MIQHNLPLVLILGLCACSRPVESAPSTAGLGKTPPRATAQTPATGKVQATVDPDLIELEVPDGDRLRTFWIDPRTVVEFSPNDSGAGAILAAEPAAVQGRSPSPYARLWTIPRGVDTDVLTAELNRGPGTNRFAPVMRMMSGAAGPLRAPCGGVIARFPSEWDQARIDVWLAGQGLTILRSLAVEGQAFLLDTPAGLESVRIATRLWETGELESCEPNYWQEIGSR